jgi:hypothetical protein
MNGLHVLGYFLAAAMGAYIGFDCGFRRMSWRVRQIIQEEVKPSALHPCGKGTR